MIRAADPYTRTLNNAIERPNQRAKLAGKGSPRMSMLGITLEADAVFPCVFNIAVKRKVSIDRRKEANDRTII